MQVHERQWLRVYVYGEGWWDILAASSTSGTVANPVWNRHAPVVYSGKNELPTKLRPSQVGAEFRWHAVERVGACTAGKLACEHLSILIQ
jgi:hypothetical protein